MTNKKDIQEVKDLCEFIRKSPSAYHAVALVEEMLQKAGFTELKEQDSWKIKKGGSYYVTRNGSSLMAFRMPASEYKAYQIITSHSDSPTFRIKSSPEKYFEDHYTTLNLEGYGGFISSSWFDRPLSIAGRVYVKNKKGEIISKPVNFDKDMVSIVNLAIHMNRQVNSGHDYKVQTDMLPIWSSGDKSMTLNKEVAKLLKLDEKDILDADLMLYNRTPASVWGADDEFFSSARIDNLESVYTSVRAIIDSKNKTNVNVCAVFDNEEIGSGTKQGALSTFLSDVLHRIAMATGKTEEDYYRSVAASFLISSDNGHAVHPNYPAKADPYNHVYLNAGILIKYSGNQKYCTDASSASVIMQLCNENKIPFQKFTNNSDIPGGSTLGNLSNQQVSVTSVDIGAPQLAMHSSYETAGAKDVASMIKLMSAYYNASVLVDKDKITL